MIPIKVELRSTLLFSGEGRSHNRT
uniref:Uncharacterized protein n=1 Tax=Arundo donax TaxID=35708 RepID=A0A0A9FGM2_ARUDO